MAGDSLAADRQRMGLLIGELSRHDRLYYQEDRPEVTDAEYDRLLRELRELEASHPALIRPDSPTQRFGAPPAEGFAEVRHLEPMRSLDNATNADAMRNFDARVLRELERGEPIEYCAEPKLDGAGVELIYDQGRLSVGSTRGDGHVGEDVTANLRLCPNIPLVLLPGRPIPERVSVRGEVALSAARFERLNAQRLERDQEPFANPRNAAAGSLRQLHDIDTQRLRSLEFRAYAIAIAIGAGRPIAATTQAEVLETLSAWGFAVSQPSETCRGIEAVIAYHQRLLADRNRMRIEIDGSVAKVNRLDDQAELGTLARAPRWAIAFKFPPQRETSIVLGIQAQVGRTGALTPVAELHPVRIGGVTVSHASLHNQDEVDRKQVRVGDTVVVQRAGDVIPQIVSVVTSKRPKKTRRYRLPRRCPVCRAKTVRLEGEAVTRCPNLDCPAQIKNNLRHLASRSALDVEGLGEKLIDQLVEGGLVRRFSDVFRLDAATLAGLDRMGEKSAANLMASLERAQDTTLARFLIGLGIRNVGTGVADLIAAHFGDLDPILSAGAEELEAIDGIGPTIAESVVAFFADPRNRAEVALLRKLGVGWKATAPKPRGPGPLAERTFVLTGGLAGMTRATAKERIRSLGGKVTGTVSKKTDYLVVGSDPGSKLDRAKQLKVEILDEAALEKLLAD